MLQQTQITTVIPYYERWLERFPTVQSLAAAPLDEVLKLWEGLGYYSRARNLHAAARTVVNELGGQIPTTAAGLMKLKGIGRYRRSAVHGLIALLREGQLPHAVLDQFSLRQMLIFALNQLGRPGFSFADSQ
jgi:A/G-specific adenine glycosylase